MSNKKTIDKLELEKKLEFYLINDIPLSFLFEEYEITFRQRELVLSKIRGFQRQLDRLSEMTPTFSYDKIPERYIVSSHQLPEDQSFLTKQEEYNLFKRLDEIKTELEKLPEINISELKLNIELKKQKLEKYDIEQIKKAEKIIDYLENIEKQGQNLSEEIFANLLKKMDLSCLRYIFYGGDAMNVKKEEEVNALLKSCGATMELRKGLGSTEMVSAATVTYDDCNMPGSVGAPLVKVNCKIVEPGAFDEFPYDKEGEICFAGETLMLGYYNNPQATE